MDQTKRQQEIERICRYYGKDAEEVTVAARHLGKFRSMSDSEVEANIAALEDEVIRHLQVDKAVSLADDSYV